MKIFVDLLKVHCDARHPKSASVEKSKPEKAKRPELAADVSDEDWNYFLSRWERYKKVTSLAGEEEITNQLLECCSDQLRRDRHRTFLSDKLEAGLKEVDLIKELKQIAVQKRNLLVNRFKVFKLKQDRGEPVRKFAGRVRSLASVSGYSVKSHCCKRNLGPNGDIFF